MNNISYIHVQSQEYLINVSRTYSVSQTPLWGLVWQYFQNGWEFFNQILHAYYAFLSTIEYVNFYSIICDFDEIMKY